MDLLCWDSMIYSHLLIRIFKLVLYVGKSGTRTSNAEDRFTFAIVKAKTTIGHVPYNFLLCF